jgi:AcrR family transcriptional regulator
MMARIVVGSVATCSSSPWSATGGTCQPTAVPHTVTAAIDLADRDGIESISMRKLAQELGVEAMSLYTHVRSKDDLLDGMVDAVIGMIPADADAGAADWGTSLRRMALGARGVMLRHPWVPRTIETRAAPGPAGGPCDDDSEFEFALDFILDGLHRLRQPHPTRPAAG